MNLEGITVELARRAVLTAAIDALLENLPVKPDRAGRIKRQPVYDYVADQLESSVNNHLAILVSERMEAAGYRPFRSCGTLYFKRR